MDDLGFIKNVDRLGENIVITVANAANRRLDACLRQALGVFDRDVLAASVTVVHEPAAMDGPARHGAPAPAHRARSPRVLSLRPASRRCDGPTRR